jgi:DNA modification methylase
MIDLRHCDCLAILPTLEASSVDAVVTDPPYGLGFMGKHWDASLPGLRVWTECHRVMKPGSYLMAFGGTRTYHRLIGSIEDAGFEIRDCLMWLYGSGFPKGKGCLKPAWEPITLARKPGGKIKPLGIEVCRVGYASPNDLDLTQRGVERMKKSPERGTGRANMHEGWARPWMDKPDASTVGDISDAGRWPANLLLQHHSECNGECHPECVVRVLGEQSGTLTSGGVCGVRYETDCPGSINAYGEGVGKGGSGVCFSDSGTAARFFPQFRYEAKASRSERNAGCEGMEEKDAALYCDDEWGVTKRRNGDGKLTNGNGKVTPQSNSHPTVKPLAVMQWLVKLACPDGGLVLDPFAGSGTTGMACERLGCSFLGIEINPDYFAIAQKRIAAEQAKMSLFAGIEA